MQPAARDVAHFFFSAAAIFFSISRSSAGVSVSSSTSRSTREPFVYKPAHRRESVLRERLREFVRDVFDGRADSLVLRLVEDETLTPAELREIEKKIAAAEKKK